MSASDAPQPVEGEHVSGTEGEENVVQEHTSTTNETTAPLLVTAPVPRLHEHSNANLLKIDTHDCYSTVSAIKRFITKSLAAQGTTASNSNDITVASLLPGLQRINKSPKNPHIFLAFATPADRAAAVTLLQSLSYRGRRWCEVPVTTRDLQLTHKGGKRLASNEESKVDGEEAESEALAEHKRPREEPQDKSDGQASSNTITANVSKVAQYAALPMSEQLARKEHHCLSILRALLPPRQYGFEAHHKCFAGLLPSPQTEGYRNHVNLTFGYTAAGAPTLGFNTGAIIEGKASIDPATDPAHPVLTMHPIAIAIAAAVMDKVCRPYLTRNNNNNSNANDGDDDGSDVVLPVMDRHTGAGFWRRLQIRHNVHGEVMLDVELDPSGVADSVVGRVTERLVRVCTAAELTAELQAVSRQPRARVVSVQYHVHKGIGSACGEAARVVLYGDARGTLTEDLAGLHFELSPTSFFQVNTPAMEGMLARLCTEAALQPSTTLLDLCCGTGTIGLALARHVRRVIGIELVEAAVVNARANARRNGVANATYHCGRVEQLLPSVLQALPLSERHNNTGGGDLVAIVDPPRAGVSGAVLRWIRGTPGIRRVIYISCEQKALLRDCPHLTKPSTKAYRGDPFVLRSSFAVDMFPHTPHVEMIVVLTRNETSEESKEGEEEEEKTVKEGEQAAEEAAISKTDE